MVKRPRDVLSEAIELLFLQTEPVIASKLVLGVCVAVSLFHFIFIANCISRTCNLLAWFLRSEVECYKFTRKTCSVTCGYFQQNNLYI